MTRPAPADQERLYNAIGAALLKSVPEDWDDILLRITATESGEISLVIYGPGGVSNLRSPDDALYPPVFELYALFARDGSPFERCDFSVKWDGTRETWGFKAEYGYPPKA